MEGKDTKNSPWKAISALGARVVLLISYVVTYEGLNYYNQYFSVNAKGVIKRVH